MKRLILSFSVVTGAVVGGMLAGVGLATSAWAKGRDAYPALDTFARAMTAIEGQYVEEITADRLVQSAISGMTHSLDRHSVYLDPDEWQALQDRNEGRWFGIGVELHSHDKGARIGRVVRGGPADLAGVLAEDLLVSIDGEELAGRSLSDVAESLDGDRGQVAQLGILRGEALKTLPVVRDQVIAPAVTSELLAPGQAYVRLEHFRQRASAELERDLVAMEQEGGVPLQAVVLDLRDNPGGLLEEAVAVVDLFLGEGLVVETRGRDQAPVESHQADDSDNDRDVRLAVLINEGSASASEIVAGALQDHGRATIVGTPSYGKGSVQQVYEFEDGSALKLTVARYFLHSGRTFDAGEGVHPDVEVHLADAPAQSVAALRDALATLPPDQSGPLMEQLDTLAASAGTEPPPPVPRAGDLATRLAADPQLEAAWDQVRNAP